MEFSRAEKAEWMVRSKSAQVRVAKKKFERKFCFSLNFTRSAALLFLFLFLKKCALCAMFSPCGRGGWQRASKCQHKIQHRQYFECPQPKYIPSSVVCSAVLSSCEVLQCVCVLCKVQLIGAPIVCSLSQNAAAVSASMPQPEVFQRDREIDRGG